MAAHGKTRRHRRKVGRVIVLVAVVIAAGAALYCLCRHRGGDLRLSGEDIAGTTAVTAPAGETTVPTTTDTATTASTADTETTTADTTTAGTTTAAPTTAKPTTTTKPTTAPTTPVNTEGHYVQKSVSSWELRLVNPWNPLPEGYNYTEHLTSYASQKEFDERAINALRQMIAAGSQYDIYGASLYRSYDLQTKLFKREVGEWESKGYKGAAAEAKAATEVARPGTSEHHLGLAVDILGSGYGSLVQSFDKTPAYAWLKEHCAEYGFIMRYPKEKEDVTGVIYEPWHYRYVGVEVATEIMSRGLTLEEYLEEKGL